MATRIEQVSNNLDEARKHIETAYNNAMGAKARRELEIASGALHQARTLLRPLVDAAKGA